MSAFRSVLYVVLLGFVFTFFGTGCAENDVAGTVVALERGALDRWGKGEPAGYMDLFADEMTYFDPSLQQRLNGREAVREFLAPIEGKLSIDSYEMIGPQVQVHDDIAVLTYNLVDYVRTPDGSLARSYWNSTEVYLHTDGKWKLIHSHWSQPKENAEGTEAGGE